MAQLPVSPSRPSPRRPGASRKVSAYERLKQAIMSGELSPGEPLIELALAEWCNVSRTPIREALTRLEQDGLVQRNERGLLVRESSPEEILDIYDTRIALESKAAAVAAERRTSIDLVAMRRAAEHAQRADATDPQTLAETNREFHRTVWRASRNESLIDLLERLNLHLGRYPATTLAYPGRHDASHVEHQDLVEAIAARDPETASAVATRHFTAARDIRLRLWESE
ncbi:GntR family transcriptional regulator [Pseudonocardia acidicola]|uniref:GntR family transcriptional regulator n=1 Tax=Pseudonocardia acidicola TaxID=2724939 RepID=A0ABX1S5G2_9PSEU|nr:GntR family transcriptional regulator [Pseudonocardia acidicola]NMH96816.1 GntR family transcriptional regulator [Pseudonocardia acidicola]